MKLTWHIVWKDLRRHRWALGVLVLFHVGMIYGAERAFGSELRGTGSGFGALWEVRASTQTGLLIAAAFMLSYVLVAAFVHADPAVGVTAEWVTRPISGARLLGAKLLGLALGLVILPLAVLLPWWLACGFGPAEIGQAARSVASLQGLIVIAALPWAVLTDRYGRFLFWTLVGLTGLAALAVITVPVRNNVPGARSGEARAAFWIAVTLATAVAVTVHQFLTRRRARSVAILIGGVLAGWLAALFWPAAWFWAEGEKGGATVDSTEITLVAGEVRIRARPSGLDEVRVPYVVRGVPEGWLAFGGSQLRAEWRGADGQPFPANVSAWSDLAEGPVRKMLGLMPWTEAEELKRAPRQWWFDLGAAQAAQLQPGKVSLRGVARLWLKRAQVEGMQPLRVGERWTESGRARRIANIGREGDEVVVTVVERGLPRSSRGSWIRFGSDFSSLEDLAGYWTLNPVTDRISDATAKRSNTVWIGGVEIRRTALRLSAAVGWDATGTDDEIARKLAGMSLAKLSYGEDVRLEVPFSAERLEVVGK